MRKLFHSVGTGFQYRLWIKTKVTIGNGDTTEGSVDGVFGSNPVKERERERTFSAECAARYRSAAGADADNRLAAMITSVMRCKVTTS